MSATRTFRYNKKCDIGSKNIFTVACSDLTITLYRLKVQHTTHYINYFDIFNSCSTNISIAYSTQACEHKGQNVYTHMHPEVGETNIFSIKTHFPATNFL